MPTALCRVTSCVLASVTLAAWPVAGFAQSKDAGGPASPAGFVHESWTVHDGLPINSITRVRQSRTGYIWLATFDGLVRFDGVRFTVFNSANSDGLPTNRLTRIFETRDSTIWLVSEARQLIRLRKGRFTTIAAVEMHDGPAVLTEDRNGAVWVATADGVGVVRGDSVARVAADEITGEVSGIAEGADGTIWVAGSSRLYRVRSGRAALVTGFGDIASGAPLNLSVDSAGAVWIGTPRVVFRYIGVLSRVALPGSRPGSSINYSSSGKPGELWANTGDRIYRLDARGAARVFTSGRTNGTSLNAAYDRQGRLWYSTGPDVFVDGKRVDLGSSRLGAPNVVSIAADDEGSVWLATTASGLIHVKPATFSVLGLAEGVGADNVFIAASDRSGVVWTSTLTGVTKVAANRVTRIAIPGASNVGAIFEDRSGRLWLGALACHQPDMRCATPQSTPVHGEVRAIQQDPDGTLWFGSSDGLFTLRGESWSRFRQSDGAPAATVRSFARTRDGALWMGTNGGGISRYRDGRFTRVTTSDGLPSNYVRALYADADGWLWVGTEGMGLARIDPREWSGRRGNTNHIVSIRQKDGLFDNGIHQILDDGLGRLWMSSNRGISSVPRNQLNAFAAGRTRGVHSTSYGERDGLRNPEANGGSQPAGTRTPDGRLWFPTQGGLAVIDPRQIRNDKVAPAVVIERVVAGGAPVDYQGRLEIGSAQRDLEFDYTALSFLAPENLRFRYRLDPYDKDWTDADTRRTAFYTRVPPGYYTFHVTATNDAGVWNGRDMTLAFHVRPLFYETRWFLALVVLVFGLMVLAAVRWRIRQLQSRADELQVRVDERTAELRESETMLATRNAQLQAQAEQLTELDRAKSRFFANVSHEFRTPLTLTIGPLEDARAHLATKDEPEAVGRIDMALRSARRLFTLVTQLLDVAKLEAGQMKLHSRTGDLVVFARGVASSFSSLAEKKRIVFDLDVPSGEVTSSFDPDALEKVIANLLSNAFKFTPEGGRITLSIDIANDGAQDVALLRVSDSGPGIPEHDVPHVFDRFYQVDESSTRAQPGTGIGLALAKELVELHGGTIVVESARSGGATFTVTLPVHRESRRVPPHVGAPSPADVGPYSMTAGERAEAPPGNSADDVTTLLVVDDSADMRAYVRSRFESRYRVIEAADGDEGILRARQSLPDLVISDVVMPGRNGHELCDALRSNPETDFIPVILLTAQGESEQRIAGLDRGADDYIAKPFDMRELEARVDNLIASRRRLRDRFSGDRIRLQAPAPDQRSPADRVFLDRLTAALEANLGNPDFGVAELAKEVFQDRSHLFRRTRALLGETPSDLLRRVRLEHAARLLGAGDDGIADIAYGVGFNSVSAFCRAFREHYKLTPSGFRESRAAVR